MAPAGWVGTGFAVIRGHGVRLRRPHRAVLPTAIESWDFRVAHASRDAYFRTVAFRPKVKGNFPS